MSDSFSAGFAHGHELCTLQPLLPPLLPPLLLPLVPPLLQFHLYSSGQAGCPGVCPIQWSVFCGPLSLKPDLDICLEPRHIHHLDPSWLCPRLALLNMTASILSITHDVRLAFKPQVGSRPYKGR